MKKTQLRDYASRSKEELIALVLKEKEALQKNRLVSTVKKTKNVREIYMKRKEIAQLKTLIREKELKNG